MILYITANQSFNDKPEVIDSSEGFVSGLNMPNAVDKISAYSILDSDDICAIKMERGPHGEYPFFCNQSYEDFANSKYLKLYRGSGVKEDKFELLSTRDFYKFCFELPETDTIVCSAHIAISMGYTWWFTVKAKKILVYADAWHCCCGGVDAAPVYTDICREFIQLFDATVFTSKYCMDITIRDCKLTDNDKKKLFLIDNGAETSSLRETDISKETILSKYGEGNTGLKDLVISTMCPRMFSILFETNILERAKARYEKIKDECNEFEDVFYEALFERMEQVLQQAETNAAETHIPLVDFKDLDSKTDIYERIKYLNEVTFNQSVKISDYLQSLPKVYSFIYNTEVPEDSFLEVFWDTVSGLEHSDLDTYTFDLDVGEIVKQADINKDTLFLFFVEKFYSDFQFQAVLPEPTVRKGLDQGDASIARVMRMFFIPLLLGDDFFEKHPNIKIVDSVPSNEYNAIVQNATMSAAFYAHGDFNLSRRPLKAITSAINGKPCFLHNVHPDSMKGIPLVVDSIQKGKMVKADLVKKSPAYATFVKQHTWNYIGMEIDEVAQRLGCPSVYTSEQLDNAGFIKDIVTTA